MNECTETQYLSQAAEVGRQLPKLGTPGPWASLNRLGGAYGGACIKTFQRMLKMATTKGMLI